MLEMLKDIDDQQLISSGDEPRTLLLVRHAKSSWSDFSVQDFDRPLNDRGKRDAPMMAKRLSAKGIDIDAILSSPAKRARKTAETFARQYEFSSSAIQFIDELYLATLPVFFDIISKANDDNRHLAIFSHNNGITDFANQLTETRIDEIQTCGIFAVRVFAKNWKEFKEAKKEFWFYDSPKAKE